MGIRTHKVAMNVREINEAVKRLREEKWRLQTELEENGGEVTDSVLSREQIISDIKDLLMSPEGVDSLGRYIRSNQDEIQSYKDEKKFIDTRIKNAESYNNFLLGLVDDCLKECESDKAKGNHGYSFTQNTSVTTKVDTRMLKERFHEKAMEAIRNTDIPKDITITLSASVSSLPEGSELPEWYNVSSVGKATFRKPRKATEEEFKEHDF